MVAKTIAWPLVAVIAVVLAYAVAPRTADLRGFDPAAMARLETAMWRDYYERHYPTLIYHLYEVSRTQFGFSPLTVFALRWPPQGPQKRSSRRGRGRRPMQRRHNS